MTYQIGELVPIKRYWVARNGNIPERFWGRDFADIKRDTGQDIPDIKDWVSDLLAGKIIKNPGGLGETGVGILLEGDPGRGKTTTAVTTIMEIVRQLPDLPADIARVFHYAPTDCGFNTRGVYYLTMPDFINQKKAVWDADPDEKRELQRELDGFYGRAKEDWLNVRVLILDDLGKEYGSEFNKVTFDDILRARYDKGLPTIITTNKPLAQWKKDYSEAMHSFAREAFRRVTLEGKDQR